MNPRLKKILRFVFVVFIGPTLFGAVVLWFLLATETGTKWAFKRVGIVMKGAVKVDSLKGTLKSPLEISGLHYKSDTMTVDIRSVRLKWRLGALLRRQLDIELLDADGVRVVLAPDKKKKEKPLVDVHLPVNIIVRKASIRDVTISGEEPKNPLVIDSVELATTAIADKIHLNSLTVKSPLLNLDASGDVTPLGAYPVSLKAAWSYRPPGSAAFEGRGSFTGTLEKLDLDQELRLPFPARLAGKLTSPLSDLSLDTTLEFHDFVAQRFDPAWPEATLGGSLHARGRLDALEIEGTLATRSALADRMNADFKVLRKGEEWKVARLNLTLPGKKTSLTAEGVVFFAKPEMRLDLHGRWRDFPWPLTGNGPPLFVSRIGEFGINGTLHDYALTVAADLVGQNLPAGRWSLKGKGNLEGIRVPAFEGSLLNGGVAGSADVTWKPELTWRVALKGDGLDPAQKWAGWPGRVGMDVATNGTMRPAGADARIEIANLRGSLRGQKLSGGALVDMKNSETLIRRFDVTAGGTRATLSGMLGSRNALAFTLSAPNIGVLVDGAQGSLKAAGNVDGTKKAPRVRATLEGEALKLGSRTLARLKGSFDVDLGPDGLVTADLQGTELKWGDRSIDVVTLKARGSRSRHELTLEATSKAAGKKPDKSGSDTLLVKLEGGLSGAGIWVGNLTRLDLKTSDLGSWSLKSPASLRASTEVVEVRGFCWTSSGGGLCAEGSWRKAGPWSVQSTIQELPLALLAAWLPDGVNITGALNGRIDAKADATGVVTADIDLKPGPGTLRYGIEGEGGAEVPFQDASLTIHAGGAGAEGKFSALLPGTGTMTGDLTLPQYNGRGLPQKSQSVRGHLKLDLSSLAFLQAFNSRIEHLKGSARADLAIGGTMAAPTVLGEGALTGGEADVPEFGLQLRGIRLKARGDGKGPLLLEGEVTSGDGKLTFTGQTPLVPGAASESQLLLRGDHFQVLNTAEGKVLVSPNVKVVITANKADVSGDVEVPFARLERKKKFGTVSLSRDIVFVGAAAEVPEKQRAISARIRLVLGEKVRFKEQGFDALITGSLLASDQPGKETTGTGELQIKEGTYKAYGQDLTIEHGRLFFGGGPIDNPGIDARAFRRARDGVVAGINIKGTLRAPEVTVYSEPPMAQSEALSYLLLGHPLSQANQQEGGLVTNAAASLGIKGGNLLAKKLAAKFGLEEAKIETEGTYKEAALVLGKFLTPKLYVSYGIGLFDRVSTLRLNYILSRRWTVKAETGSANGADVVYTIEK